MSELKAWSVSYDYGERGDVIWARTYPEARRLGASALDCDWEDVSDVRRVPELDDGTEDLLGWQLDNDWHFECHDCYRRCSQDSGYTRRADRVFCNEDCAGNFVAKRMTEHRREAEVARTALDTHPDGTIERQWSNGYGSFASVRMPDGRRETFEMRP